MSLAKKCNRCGVYYDYKGSPNARDYNGVVTVWINEDGSYSPKEKNDFCPKCKADFDNWFNAEDEGE